MHFITGKHIPRRTFLHGMGAMVGLPMLDAMVPAGIRRTGDQTKPTRFVAIEEVHGVPGCNAWGATQNLWAPAKVGRDFDLSAPNAMVSRAPARPICAPRPPTVAAPRLPPMRKTRVSSPRAPPRVRTGTESATSVVMAGCPRPKESMRRSVASTSRGPETRATPPVASTSARAVPSVARSWPRAGPKRTSAGPLTRGATMPRAAHGTSSNPSCTPVHPWAVSAVGMATSIPNHAGTLRGSCHQWGSRSPPSSRRPP